LESEGVHANIIAYAILRLTDVIEKALQVQKGTIGDGTLKKD